MFSPVHLHLLGNHVPILLSAIAFVILVIAAVKRRDDWTQRALVFAFVAGAAALPTYLSGSNAEEQVEDLPGVTDAWIEPHKEAGKIAAIAAGVLAVAAAGVLFVFRGQRPLPGLVRPLGLVGLAIVAGLMGWTGYLGGQIRHTEVRPGGMAAPTATGDKEETTEGER